jgi:hypothetical protein
MPPKSKTKKSLRELPGIGFERAVASLQAALDPSAVVTHNEVIIDRLGQSRQFDVVIRGVFAGQQMLGVIECKDLGQKLGTPAVDAFVTKAQDINANFKILVSRRGFSEPALIKCKHYGLQALSLIPDDPANKAFSIGSYWTGEVTRWSQMRLTLHGPTGSQETFKLLQIKADQVTISGNKVLDWYNNYLINIESKNLELGWIAGVTVEFEEPQLVTTGSGEEVSCVAISFEAERVCDQYEYFVGLNGSGFFNWHTNQASLPPGAVLVTDAVPTDFSKWQPKTKRYDEKTEFLHGHVMARADLRRIEGAIDLDQL